MCKIYKFVLLLVFLALVKSEKFSKVTKQGLPSLYSVESSVEWELVRNIIKREVKKEVSNELVKWGSINGISNEFSKYGNKNSVQKYGSNQNKMPSSPRRRNWRLASSKMNRKLNRKLATRTPRTRKVNKPVETFSDTSCSLWGSGHHIHYKTFDSKFFDLTNDFCVYTILKTDNSNRTTQTNFFQVDVQTREKGRTDFFGKKDGFIKRTVFVKLDEKSTLHMEISLEGYRVSLFEPSLGAKINTPIVNCSFNDITRNFDGTDSNSYHYNNADSVSIYDSNIVSEFDLSKSKRSNPETEKCRYFSDLGNFKIEYMPEKAGLLLQLPTGASVEVSKFGRVQVKLVGTHWKGTVSGLCGNNDGNYKNEMKQHNSEELNFVTQGRQNGALSNSIRDWASSWNYLNSVKNSKLREIGSEVCNVVKGVRLCRSIYKIPAKRKCSPIFSEAKIKPCLQHLSTKSKSEIFRACTNDSCIKGSKWNICGAMEQMVASCNSIGIKVEDEVWMKYCVMGDSKFKYQD